MGVSLLSLAPASRPGRGATAPGACGLYRERAGTIPGCQATLPLLPLRRRGRWRPPPSAVVAPAPTARARTAPDLKGLRGVACAAWALRGGGGHVPGLVWRLF